MKKLAWLFVAVFFVLGCASAPVKPATPPAEPYLEKTESDSELIYFPEAIVLYSKDFTYNNRVSKECQPRFRASLEINKEMSRFERAMTLKCAKENNAGTEVRALIVNVKTDDPQLNPAKFVAMVEVGEPIKMMEVTQYLLTHLAGQLSGLTRFNVTPSTCPNRNKIEFDLTANPNSGIEMARLLADRLATTRLADGSRYLRYDEVVAAWKITRPIAALRAGCLPDEEVDGAVAQFQEWLNRLYKGEVK